MFMVSQLARMGYDIIVLDWKNTWRKLLRMVDPNRVLIFTLAKNDVAPLYANPLRPPVVRYHNDPRQRIVVPPSMWADVLAELFAYAYAPFPRSRSIVLEEIDNLYRQTGVYENHGDPRFTEYPTMSDLVDAVLRRLERVTPQVHGRGEIESINAIRSRLWEYRTPTRILNMEFGTHRIGIPIERLYEGGRIVIIEAFGLTGSHRQFLLSWLATGAYMYQMAVGRPRERPLLIVLEESQHLIPPQTILEEVHIMESVWETMFREIGEYNIWLWAIAQVPSRLPITVLGNTPFKLVFNLSSPSQQTKDADIMLEQLSLDPRWDHRHVKRFLTRLPPGQAVVRLPEFPRQEYGWPYLVQVPYIGEFDLPTDDEIRGRMVNIIRSLITPENQEH